MTATQRDLAPPNPCHRIPLPQPRPRLRRLLAHLRPRSAPLDDAHHPATPTPAAPSPAPAAGTAATPAALRPADIAHFRDFGYCVLPSLFTREEAAALESATLEVMRHLSEHGDPRVASGFQQVEECLAGVEGATHWSCGGFYERHPTLRRLLMDERVYSIPETLLGPGFFLEMTDGHIRVGNTPWHGIVADDSPPCETLRVCFYFTDLNEENGCLRIVPGSHARHRRHADALRSVVQPADAPATAELPEGVPVRSLETTLGTVIVFTEEVWHGSFGSDVGRLQITSQYSAAPRTESQRAAIRSLAATHTWGYHPARSMVTAAEPRLREMVAPLVEFGFSQLEDI